MIMIDDLLQLAHVSRKLGATVQNVQGGGGNTSIKCNDAMWIKASGIFLKDISAEEGFIAVDDQAVRSGLKYSETEDDYNALLKESVCHGSGRPSMETGFHALLPKAVLHSHPILINLLCCAMGGEDLAMKLFPEAIWIPYVTPGLPLTLAIAERLNGSASPSIILLQNHGLIACGDTLDEAWYRHENCCETIADHFGISISDLPLQDKVTPDLKHVLFPDQVIYLQNSKGSDVRAAQETLAAYSTLRILFADLGMIPRYLSDKNISDLTQLDAEKHRQEVVAI